MALIFSSFHSESLEQNVPNRRYIRERQPSEELRAMRGLNA
jgi:hypothetical protein